MKEKKFGFNVAFAVGGGEGWEHERMNYKETKPYMSASL
jgi:hypothetical protein